MPTPTNDDAKPPNTPRPKIIPFPGVTRLDLSPDLVLQEAVGKLEGCVIIGFDEEGDEYFAASYADAGDVLYHLERAKWRLMQRIDDLAAESDGRAGPPPNSQPPDAA